MLLWIREKRFLFSVISVVRLFQEFQVSNTSEVSKQRYLLNNNYYFYFAFNYLNSGEFRSCYSRDIATHVVLQLFSNSGPLTMRSLKKGAISWRTLLLSSSFVFVFSRSPLEPIRYWRIVLSSEKKGQIEKKGR